jgi:ComF family protein
MAGRAQIEAGLRRVPAAVLDLLLPPRCLACGTSVDGPGRLCPACWGGLTFLGEPACGRCGVPFAADRSAPFCAACLRQPPHFDRARAALVYDDASRPLVLAFKHGDRTDAAPAYAAWLARAAAPLLARGVDIVVPVPLHRWRLLGRRYNQSALLAQALARLVGRPYQPAAVRRTRRTRSQGHLSAAARERNVRGAFAADPALVKGRAVLLVDDVLTSGATLGACARACKRAGARSVQAVTLARVVRTDT